MRCKTAREYFCRNRDAVLDEAMRIRLQRHLAACPACAAWCGEMEGCMKLLAALPEMETSENFEWNLKRRIAMERSRAMRSQAGIVFGGRAWGLRFVAGAAAALGVVFAAALLLGVRGPQRYAEVAQPAGDVRAVAAARSSGGERQVAPSGYPAGIRYVSDRSFGGVPADESMRALPFSSASDPGVDDLIRENELLRRQMEEMRRQNMIMRKLLIKCSNERQEKR